MNSTILFVNVILLIYNVRYKHVHVFSMFRGGGCTLWIPHFPRIHDLPMKSLLSLEQSHASVVLPSSGQYMTLEYIMLLFFDCMFSYILLLILLVLSFSYTKF